MKSFRIVALTSALLGATLCAAADKMVVPRLREFDGQSFGGIEFGVTTDAMLKKMYAAGKGSLRPEGVLVETTDSRVRVDALLDGRGAKAKVIALYVTYGVGGAESIQSAFPASAKMDTYFFSERFMDCMVEVDEGLGMACLVDSDRSNARVMAALLGEPGHVSALIRKLDSHASRLGDFRSYQRSLQDLSIGRVTFSLSSSGLEIDRNRSLTDRLRNTLEDAIDSRELAVSRRGDGSASGRGSANFKAGRGGSVSVSVDLQVNTPLGAVTSSGSYYQSIRKDERRPNTTAEDYLEVGATRAANDAVKKLFATYDKMIPQTPEDHSNRYFWALTNSVTK